MTGKMREPLPLAGGEWLVSFTTKSDPCALFDALKDKDINVEIKKASKGRSRDANAYCWALCSLIGNSMTPPQSKEDIYRMAIKAVGVYTEVTLYAWDVKVVLRRWSSHGVGWFAEIVDEAGTGKKLVHLYYGTSTYSVDEMRTILDWLVDQTQQMGLAIPLSKDEEEDLLKRWGEK